MGRRIGSRDETSVPDLRRKLALHFTDSMRFPTAFVALAASFLLHGCEPNAPSLDEATLSSLVNAVGKARAEYDETVFRSVRKDGRLVNTVTMAGRTEVSLTPPVPSKLSFPTRLPAAPHLRFSTGVSSLGEEELPAPVSLQIYVEADGQRRSVFSETIRRGAGNLFRDHDVNLSSWAGRDVTLTLESAFSRGRNRTEPVLVSWGDPILSDEGAPPAHPLIVLVSIDCLRADHVGVYGYSRPTTPAIDALAAEGTVFENAFSTASWTLPAHMSMLTGLVPSLHGATKTEKLSSSVPYLPELLAAAGYRTVGVVSWVYLSQVYGFERGFRFYQVLDDPEAGDVVDVALEQLKRGESEGQFLFLHLYEPHWPYLPPPGPETTFGERPRDISTLLEMTSHGAPPKDELQVEEVIRLYDGEVAAADRELGRMFRALREKGLYDDALIIVTADHGEAFYEHGHWQHSVTLYDEVTHVPLVVKWPGKTTAVARSARPVSLVDIFATLTEAAGVEAPESPEGILGRWSLASEGPESRRVVSEVTWVSPNDTTMKVSLRSQTIKYILQLAGPPGGNIDPAKVVGEEIYDLVADPHERSSLLPEASVQTGPFREAVRSFLATASEARRLRKGDAVELDEETLEKLKSLGYTH